MLELAVAHRLSPDFALAAAFTAPAGLTAIFGPSGAGKSTLLHAASGLLRPDAGRIALHGRVLLDTASGVFVPPERRRCGVVFQEARLFPHLTVVANLRYGERRAPRDASGPGLDEIVALLGIGALLARRPAGLSGGERQRVALGRALLSRPALLLMDEPLAALDAPRRGEILPFLERLRDAAKVPILYITHALDEVDRLADTLVLLDGGALVAVGPVGELMLRTDLALLARRRDAGTLLACTIAGHDPVRGLSWLNFPGGRLIAPLRTEAPGRRLRLRLRARDVAVARDMPAETSWPNRLPATLIGIEPAGAQECFLRLAIGPSTLLARVLRDSVAQLGLAQGEPVIALLTASAFDHA